MATTAPALPVGRSKPVRRNELDWLRTFAVLGLIPFHAAVIFTTGSGDYVKNAETSRAVDAFVAFISVWGIPLIFFIAGAGARFALQLRTPSQYLRERFTRLVIPFLFGIVAIVPIQVYIGQVARTGSLPAVVPFYADHLAMLLRIFTGVVPTTGADWIGHLWFIPQLILFALLILPVDRFFYAPGGRRLLNFLASRGDGIGILLLFGLPLGLANLLFQGGSTLSPELGRVAGLSLFVTFLLDFMYGYVIYADARLEAAVRRAGPPALLLAVPIWGAVEAFKLAGWRPAPGVTPGYAVYSLVFGYVSWLWVVAILSYGMRYLARTNGLLRYLNEATYPVYVLHMPILSLVALFVVRWDLPLLLKLLLITVATLVVTFGIYDLVVRRVGILRFLFGLKRRPPAARPTGHGPSVPPFRSDTPRCVPASDEAPHRAATD